MERFDLTLVARGMECWQELSPAPDGDYCSYYAAEEERKILVSRIRSLEEALANALQAQARFVPCSERLPTKPGEYVVEVDHPYAGIIMDIATPELISYKWDRSYVVAWLDNLPPLDGSARIKEE